MILMKYLDRLMTRVKRYRIELRDTKKLRRLIIESGLFIILVVGTLLVSLSSPYTTTTTTLTKGDSLHISYVRATVLTLSSNPDGTGAADVHIHDGPGKGRTVTVQVYGGYTSSDTSASYKPGSTVLLTYDRDAGTYGFVERWRLPAVGLFVTLLLVLVVMIGRWRGITSIVGLFLSIIILFNYTVPQITAGANAYVVSMVSAFAIALLTIFIAHGLNRRAVVAFISTVATLGVTIVLTLIAWVLIPLFDYLDEDSIAIVAGNAHISLPAVLYGGIIIASLGVLNDITVGQAATVDELHATKKRLGFGELYRRAMNVGREHIAALVNTLALAYVGVGLPTLVLFALYNGAPLLVMLNNSVIVIEILRTVLVSISLLLAVPISTLLAAWLIPKWPVAMKKLRWRR